MPLLQITTFRDAGEVALGEPIDEQVVTIAGTSNESTALPGTKLKYRVRLFADTDCFVTWGLTPDAQGDGSDGRMLAAESPEYFEIEAGKIISVIERT